MPTYDWIREAAEERWEGAEPAPLHAQNCPVCGEVFVSPDNGEAAGRLSRHLATKHPLARPVLMIRARPAAMRETVRAPIRPAELLIANCTEIDATVDGEHRGIISEGATIRLLSSGRSKGFVRLRMRNVRGADRAAAEAEFNVRFDIPSLADLDTIETAFIRHLARDEPSSDDVRRFADETDGLIRDYVDGLAAYVLAVIAKDGRGNLERETAVERAQENLGRASSLLAEFADREVAEAIAACANFNLNVFTSEAARCGVAAIQLATRFFLELMAGGSRPHFPGRPQEDGNGLRCPVDRATAWVLECLFRVAAEPGADPSQLLEATHAAGATAADRAKVQMSGHRGSGADLGMVHRDPVSEGQVGARVDGLGLVEVVAESA